MMRKSLFLAGLLVLPASAWAGELRDLCPDRPGKATPACILDPGHVEYEASIADWAHDRSGGAVDDGLLIGDSLLRIGLTTATEVQIGWTAWGQDRTRDASGVSKSSGTGDVTISIRHSLQNPDGKGVSIALQPFVSLPVGGSAIGAGDWGAGLTIPASFELLRNLQFAVVPTIEAAVDDLAGLEGDGVGAVVGAVPGSAGPRGLPPRLCPRPRRGPPGRPGSRGRWDCRPAGDR